MRKIQGFFERFLLDSGYWGYIRLAFVLIMTMLFAFLGHQAFRRVSIAKMVTSWIMRRDILAMVPGVILRNYAFIVINLRFIWLAVSAFAAAVFIGASYLSRMYPDANYAQGLNYLIRSLFTLQPAKVIIRDGNVDHEAQDSELVRIFGGPGSVVVDPGNVVILEHLDRISRVVPEGVHHLTRFEKIKELQSDFEYNGKAIPTLNDRHGYINKSSATTKDGIEIEMTDIHYRYRLRMEQGFGDYVERSPKRPFPVSVEGALNMAYNRTIRINPKTKEREITPWHDLINITVEGAIIDYLRGHKFDSLIMPAVQKRSQAMEQSIRSFIREGGPTDRREQDRVFTIDHPRDVISENILSKNLRGRLRSYGADLLWWDIGHISIRNPVVIQQLLDNWGTYWDGRALVERARGEAERARLREIGQAEFQAEMLLTITRSLEAVLADEEEGRTPEEARAIKRERVRSIILTRTTQLLENITSGGDFP